MPGAWVSRPATPTGKCGQASVPAGWGGRDVVGLFLLAAGAHCRAVLLAGAVSFLVLLAGTFAFLFILAGAAFSGAGAVSLAAFGLVSAFAAAFLLRALCADTQTEQGGSGHHHKLLHGLQVFYR